MKVTVQEVKKGDEKEKKDSSGVPPKLKGAVSARKHIAAATKEEAADGDWIAGQGEGAYTESGRIKYVPPLTLGIQEWDPDEIPIDSFVICYGKRRTGKSFFTRDFFHRVRGRFWHVNVYTGTKHNGFYQEFMDDRFVIKGFQPQGLRNLLDIQEKLKEAQFKGDLDPKIPVNALVWLDDVISDNDVRHSEEFNETASAGRHYDLMVGVNTQHVTGIPPVIRVNADIVVIFTQLNWTYKKQLAEEYLGMLNPRTAMELIDYYTRDHGCLVIELWKNDATPTVLIHYYKAGEPERFNVHVSKVNEDIQETINNELGSDSDGDEVDLNG